MNRMTVRVIGSRSILPVTAWAVLLGASMALTGCVSSTTYELAKRDAQNATLLLQHEQRRIQDLTAEHKRMTQRIEQLQADLQKTQQELTVRDQAWRETRDELLQLKIDQEKTQHQIKRRLKEAKAHLQQEQAALETALALQAQTQGQSEDTKRRIQELIQEIQNLLDRMARE